MFIDQSDEVGKVLPALVKAKASIGKVAKGAANPFFKSKYADLPAILDVVEPALADNDLALLQPISDGVVVTTFIHKSGEFVSIEGQELVAAKQNDPQAMGSAITYARRYSLSSALSINADRDDDGEAAMSRNKTSYRPATKPSPKAEATKTKATPETIEKMKAACKTAAGKEQVRKSLRLYDMTAEDLKVVTEALEK